MKSIAKLIWAVASNINHPLFPPPEKALIHSDTRQLRKVSILCSVLDTEGLDEEYKSDLKDVDWSVTAACSHGEYLNC